MMILFLQMIMSLLTTPTMTRTTSIAVHVPVIKGGASNVSSGGLQSTPNDDILFSPWDVWLMHEPSASTSTIDYFETVNHTASYQNLDIPREESRIFVYSCHDDNCRQQRDMKTKASGAMCGTGHHGEETEGVTFTSLTETTLVIEIPPEPPPGRQVNHPRKQGACAPPPTSLINPQRGQHITETHNIKLRRPWDVGRGEMNESKEHDGDFRSWSRPGVKLPIDQNATGDESGVTPSSSQQGSNKSRKEDLMYHPWDTGSQIGATRTEPEELQLHTWDVWDGAWLSMDTDE